MLSHFPFLLWSKAKSCRSASPKGLLCFFLRDGPLSVRVNFPFPSPSLLLPLPPLLLLLLLLDLGPSSSESGEETRTLLLAAEERVGVRRVTTVTFECEDEEKDGGEDEDDEEAVAARAVEGELLRFFLSLSFFFLPYTELPNLSETMRILPMGVVLAQEPLLLSLMEPTTGVGSEEGVSTSSIESMAGRLRW